MNNPAPTSAPTRETGVRPVLVTTSWRRNSIRVQAHAWWAGCHATADGVSCSAVRPAPCPRRRLRVWRHRIRRRRVGPIGQVVGVDCCDAFLDQARARRDRGLANPVCEADAEIALTHRSFDCVFAASARCSSHPGRSAQLPRRCARAAGWCISSGATGRQSLLSMAKDVVLQYLPTPGADAQTCGPGPFSWRRDDGEGDDEGRRYDQIDFAGQPPSWSARMSDEPSLPVGIGPGATSSRAARSRNRADRDERPAAAHNVQKKAPTAWYGQLLPGDQPHQSSVQGDAPPSDLDRICRPC